MKLAAKLILLFMLGVLGIVALFSWQTIRRQRQWDQARRADHANDVVGALTPAIVQAYRDGGAVTIQQAIEVSAQYVPGHQMRWVDGTQIPQSSANTTITSRKISSISVADKDGTTVAHTVVPLVVDGTQAGVVEISEPTSHYDHFVRGSLLASLLSLLGVAALSAVVVYWGGIQLVGKPLGKLIEQVHKIGDGQLSQPPVLNSNDELGALALAISQMSRRLDQQKNAIRHADRLGTVGTLAAGMAHEMGTPLNVVSGRANLIASGKLSDVEVRQSAQTIKSEADRMATIIRQLLDFSRQTPQPHRPLDLRDVASSTCELLQPLADKADVQIVLDTPEQRCGMDGDQAQIQQVLTNLMTNAIQAMPDGGQVQVSVEACGDDEEDRVCVRVSDEGMGIEQEDIQRIFEPFYTTKDVGQGTGLGLSIAYGIVKEHGGEIDVQSQPGSHTTFTVSFPVP
ncbi:sensor histidine kinase [Roseimaritima ulvae]|uniref:histidine kinase n=1 Tax=Roseimaritima ulvae TaxID=980254 RepID=A0A5B9QWM0_9BACT|nr:HAMP domain-containing sensor histidine kinase [Roseimaritima ulvae]QEG41506.1 Sporulation kinase E [Roseimaritima ulvae]